MLYKKHDTSVVVVAIITHVSFNARRAKILPNRETRWPFRPQSRGALVLFVNLDQKLLQFNTGYCRLLQVTIGYYMLIQVTTGYYRLLHVTTFYYRLL